MTGAADAAASRGSAPAQEAIRARLEEVVDPCSASRGTELSIVEMGLVDSVGIDGGDVHVAMRLTGPGCMQVPYFVEQVTERVADLDAVEDVTVTTDAGLEWTPEMMSEDARETRRQRRRELAERYRELEADGTSATGSDEAEGPVQTREGGS